MTLTAALLIMLGLLFAFMRERFEASAHPSPGKLPERRDPLPPKVMNYDTIAAQQLHRIEERRRRAIPDSGMRRRKSDGASDERR
jgi:hypothetical protein